jgi:hypothetical protein
MVIVRSLPGHSNHSSHRTRILDKTKLNWSEGIAMRCAHAREGDHRDWQAIDDWAAVIARELQQTRVSSPSL